MIRRPYKEGQDVADRVDRFGCLGSGLMIVVGFALMGYARYASDGWISLTAAIVGFILIFLGGGWTFLFFGHFGRR